MKIVVLDGFLANPGDLSWEGFQRLGELTIYEHTPPNLTVERCQDAEIVITNKIPLLNTEIAQLPKLKYIGVTATGYNIVDLASAIKHKITVTNVPAYSTPSTAQHAIALLLEITNQVGLHNQAVQQGEWQTAKGFCFWKKQLIELEGLNFGIVGFGAIGQRVGSIASALGMKVLVQTRTTPKDSAYEIKIVDRDTLFKESDVISLHCPLTPQTEKMINASTLALMKRNTILINVARGGLIEEADLASALKEKRILAAGLDVLGKEPPLDNCPLLNLDNCFITPHIAWASLASRKRLIQETIKNLEAFLKGQARNVVLN